MPKKRFVGVVVSDKMDKTVTVKVERKVKHETFGKYITKSKKFYAHDENNTCKIGDVVEIEESKPFSKIKRWTVVKILEHSKLTTETPDSEETIEIEGGSEK